MRGMKEYKERCRRCYVLDDHDYQEWQGAGRICYYCFQREPWLGGIIPEQPLASIPLSPMCHVTLQAKRKSILLRILDRVLASVGLTRT